MAGKPELSMGNSVSNLVAPRRRVKVIRPPSFSPLLMFSNLANLARYGDLLYTLSLHRINVRYKQSMLGFAWAVLQPFSLMLVYTIIFSIVARIPSNGVPYAIFVYCALLPWTFFSTALTTSSNGMITHTQLITKVYFPREIIPLTYVIASLFDFLIASTILAGMMIYYRIPVTPNALYALPIMLIAFAFATTVALLSSAAQVRFRDMGIVMPLLIQLWMFATPVVYPLSQVPARYREWYQLNPLVGVVENFRRVVIQGLPPDPYSLRISALVSALALPAAYIYFKHREATMADII
jgi:lipopolysaccharide transport system permease protein